MRKHSARSLSSLLAAVLVVAGCGGPSEQEDAGLRIVATTSIWGDVISELAGEDASVEVLVPLGADAHEYQPTPRHIASLQGADLVVANGLGLEEGLTDALESARMDGANIYEVGPELDPLPFAGHDPHEEEDHEDDDEDDRESHDDDPHVWFDPLRMAIAAGLIADRMAEIDSSIDWAGRAEAYAESLVEADAAISEILATVPGPDRKLVTNHEALGYFSDRYDFEVVGVVVPGGSSLGDPSSAEMAALVDEIRHEGVDTIFAETSQPTRLAEAVAAEVGAEVAVVELFTESLGEPGSGAETLVGMLLADARLIADALSRDPTTNLTTWTG